MLGIWMPGPAEMVVLGILGLLLFGKKLPETAKNIGRTFVEFKKGMKGLEDELGSTKKMISEEVKNEKISS